MDALCPWNRFPRANDVACEPDLCAWVVHPAEAWSNLAFVAVAAALLLRYGRADRRLRVAWFPAILVAIGLGSFAFHASMVHWLHIADVAAIFLFTGFLLAAHLQHAGLIHANRFSICFLVLTAGGATLAFISPRVGWIGIAAQGVAILWLAWRISPPRARRDLLAAIALNQLGAAALWLDKSQALCVRGAFEHVLQPHSFWHILLALSLLFFYRNERQIEHELSGRAATRCSRPFRRCFAPRC